MLLAVNYSRPLARLIREGRVTLDLFKCPAWPDLIEEASALRPVYVHFPLKVGLGIADAIDSEQTTPVDWAARIDPLLARTQTPLVNLHLTASLQDYPFIPLDSIEPSHADLIVRQTIQDVQAVVTRYGPERVILENDHDGGQHYPRPVYLADTIRRVVEATGCGLLLDISHARRAADCLDMDVYAYLDALPTAHIREIHVTGVRPIDPTTETILREAGVDEARLNTMRGRLQDHLPMTETDWTLLDWVLTRCRQGEWGKPWVVTFEYGGVGRVWEALCESAVLVEQVPRLHRLVHGIETS